jgi:FkbM family methyltransferase
VHATVNLLKAAFGFRSRPRYLGKALVDLLQSNPHAFLKTCRATQISTLQHRYLDSYDITLDVNGGSISEEILTHGHYQWEYFEFLQTLEVDRDLLFVNVGGNIGSTCLNAYHAGFRDFIVFEPVAANFRLLEHNVGPLRATAHFELRQEAAGESTFETTINLNSTSSGRHSLVRDFGQQSEPIRVVRLDDVLPERPGMLWIDTEGYEHQVLTGAGEYLAKCASGLCIEITPRLLGTDGVAAIDARLRSLFGQIVSMDGTRVSSLMEIGRIRHGEQADVICLK